MWRQLRKHMCLFVLMGVFASIAFWSSACQRQDETIAGVTIPIPSGMKKLRDKVFKPIAGFDDGQASYRGRVNPGEIFTFYQENMEPRGWKPTAFLADKENHYTYARGNRICLVWSTPNNDGTTDLTIMVGTSRPST